MVLKSFNRTSWIDINTFLVISEEGIEKLIDLDNHCKELQYNYRPLFTEICGLEYIDYIYYHKRPEMDLTAVLPRL